MKRIGLFGGSFDPVHDAHLALARAARDQLPLDELLWLIAGRPWQKSDRVLAGDAHRLAMVRLAIDGEARFVADERELHRAGPSYSIDTVDELRAEHPGAELFLVIGQDQYARLHTWHRWKELLARVTLAVAGRDGQAPQPSPEVAAQMHRLVPLALPALAHSATEVRERLARGQDIAGLVPTAVASYIARHRLYQRGTPPDDTP